MKKKKLPLCAFAVANLCMLVSCGSNYTHKMNGELHCYTADLNHNGTIENDEKNLTWHESFDKLIEQSNSVKDLTEIANTMNISIDKATEPYRTQLARYEIMHQIEELVMSTGALMPLYNYEDSFMLKEGITSKTPETAPYGMYSSSLGYKFFERLIWKDGRRSNFSVCVGSKAQTMDPTKNTTVEAATMLSQALMGAKRWVPAATKEKPFNCVLADGICTSTKVVQKDGTALWTIEIKTDADGKHIKWQDGTEIKADDFIWAWNRSAASSAGTSFSSMFDCIKGYSDEKDAKGKVTKKGWHSQKDPRSYDFYGRKMKDDKPEPELEGSIGGMEGLVKINEYTFTAQLVNDCSYFEELLSFPSFMPLPRHKMASKLKEENETINISWWKGTETAPESGGYFCANGPMKFTKIDNKEGGTIEMEPNKNYLYSDEVSTSKLTFALIDDDSAMLTQYKNDTLQFIDSIAAGSIDQMKAQYPKEFLGADQTALYYFLFNVNDNAFDLDANKHLPDAEQERRREKLRWVLDLLINRNDICTNVGKTGQTPSSGFVSDGIIETCLPKGLKHGDQIPGSTETAKAPTTEGEGKTVWCISLDEETGKPNTADWQTRNQAFSGFSYRFDENGTITKYKDQYNVFEGRTITTPRTDGLDDGYFPTYNGKTDTANYDAHVKKALTYNIKLAIQLAKEAGVEYVGDLETGKFVNFPQIKLTMNAGTGHEQVAEKMQFYYKLFGINMVIETQEWNSFCASKRQGDFALARNGWTADYRDPRTYLDVNATENYNNDCQFGKDSTNGGHIHYSK